MESLGEFEYSLADVLGHGSYAMVFRGKRRRDSLQVAIKKIPLKSVPGKLSSIRQEEISILKDLKNKHIVQLYDYLDRGSDIFLVMEYCNGGDMGDYLAAKKTLSESSIRHLIKHMALALEALFKLKIIHRDIKPQNLLLSYPLTSPSSSTTHHATPVNKWPLTEAVIKLADFGFARHLYGADMAATLCGSPLYMAPEILVGQRYDHSADLWSVGVILYQSLSGSAPFLASDPHALRKRYKRETLVPKIPAGTSHYLSDLLLRLLKKNPTERLSYNDFFHHSFLKDPSTFFPADSMISQHTKSSPVPIKRKTDRVSSAFSNSPSPKHSISPHRSSSVDTSHFSSPSYSSGPPLSHRIGSQASLTYYSAQSPSSFTDVTDQGFILVDFPGNPGSRRCSVSSSGGQSSGRNSVAGYPHSNTSVGAGGSNGSLSRYSSLTTPFYQAPATSRQNQNQQQQVPRGSDGATPRNAPSPHDAGFYRSPNSIPSLISRPSPPNSVPFGKLIKCSNNSPMANISNFPSSGSSGMNYVSTPPSSITSPGAAHVIVGSKGAMSRQNSNTKLSALTEESSQSHSSRKKKDDDQNSVDKIISCGFDIITKSCLLDSEDDLDTVSIPEEENFPLGLNMSFTECEEEEGGNSKVASGSTAVNPVNTAYQRRQSCQTGRVSSGYQQHSQAQQSQPMQTNMAVDQPASGRTGNPPSRPTAVRPRRAASFSSRPDQHQQDLNAGHPRASSVTSSEESMKRGFLASMLSPSTEEEEEIVPVKVPFAFSGSSLSQGALSSSRNTAYLQGKVDHFSRPHTATGSIQGGLMPQGGTGVAVGSSGGSCGMHLGSLTLAEMKDTVELAQELQAMAKARQGPILLMSTSTSLSDSGVMSRYRRCSEQLVLYAKAISILNSIYTRYGLELALAGHEEPPQEITSLIDKVVTLKAACLNSAKDIQEEILSGKENGHKYEVRVSAERLLYMEALDMGKAALLDEKSGEQTECVKRYRRAKLILQYLVSEAHTPHDKQILHKYLQSTQIRLSRVVAQTNSH